MAVTITIAGTPIEFPESGASPDWSTALVEFAQAVEQALSLTTGTFDVPPQTLVIDAYNPGTNVNIPNLSFSTSDIRGAFIRYTVYRNTSTTTVSEAGSLNIVYNPDGPTNSKWEVSRSYTGDAQCSFTVTDTGSVQLSTETLSGIDHVGVITYTAQALQNT